MKDDIRGFIKWLGKACEVSEGVPSSVRVIAMAGSALIISTVCLMWVVMCLQHKQLVEVPTSVSYTFGTMLGSALAAKVVQHYDE